MPTRLRENLQILGGVKLKSIFEAWDGHRELWESIVGTTAPGRIRKLTAFADREGKTRVVALGDYFSQTVLRPLHDYLFGVLRKIPQDCTFDQARFKDLLSGNPGIYYSVDLKAATDRFPIKVIARVLAGHLPPSYVDA